VTAEAATAQACGDKSEDADSACGDALDERERSKRKRCDVQREADALECEAEQPAAIPQQRCSRVQRSSQREGRQRGRGIVLSEVRDVDQGGRRQRQPERNGGLRVQRASTSPWNRWPKAELRSSPYRLRSRAKKGA
jgi:hypothetical protein